MRETLYINGRDAYTTWGVYFDNTALSSLMTPPPLKAFIENKSSARDGKAVLGLEGDERAFHRPRVDSRELSLVMHLEGRNEAEFLERYARFCQELRGGVLRLETRYQPGVVYTLVYISCTQFTQFRRGIGRFTLRLEEPNPTQRG